tara:strand:- start:177 stop:395 length:219 start_codon:yes stop_codon:yes gene_type:complete
MNKIKEEENIIEKYIKLYDVKIPNFVLNSNKSKNLLLESGDINLLKSVIAYKKFTERRDKALEILEEILYKD